MARDYSNKDRFLRDVAKRAQLREGPEGAERVLRAIFEHEYQPGADALTERVLSRIARMPVPVIVAIRRELEASGILEPGLSIQMTPTARANLAQQWGWFAGTNAQQSEFSASPTSQLPEASQPLGAAPAPPSAPARPSRPPELATGSESQLCAACEGTGIDPVGAAWEVVRAGLRKHFAGKPRKVSPGRAERTWPTPDTNLCRAALMHEQGALAGKDVLVMGDDVSVAAALALAGKALSPSGRLARRIVALHSDDRALRQLRDLAVSEGAIIGLVTYDLRASLMPDLQGDFDTVFLDPPPGYAGLTLGLSRAVDALRPESGVIFLSYARPQPEELLEAQRAILESGLAITLLLPAYEAYSNGPRDLYVLQATEDSLPLIEGDYIDIEEQAESDIVGMRQTYACLSCGSQLAVGGDAAGQFPNVAALERAGCPTCGGHSFKLITTHAPGGNGTG